MRFGRSIAMIGLSSIGAMLSGVLSFGKPSFFATDLAQPVLPRRSSPPREVKRRPGATHRGWTPNFYGVAGPYSREAERRRKQGAHARQIASHKPGTVQPRHIFGGDRGKEAP